jgi:hypothetical protein
MRAIRPLCSLAAVALSIFILLGTTTAHAQTCPMAKSGKKYKVKIDSAPPGATIYLDRKDCGAIGVTPWQGTLAAGTVVAIVEVEGYEPATKSIKVAKTRKLQEVFVPLVKKIDPPKIDVSAAADKNIFGAAVFLDGQPQGTAPVVLTTTPGRHLIELRKDGFEPFQQWVEAKDNNTFALTPVLGSRPKFGQVFVEADVDAAEVYIDGNKHPDKTPTVIKQVVEGLHVIEVRKEPAVPWKQTVQVVAEQDVKVKAELKATFGGGGGNLRVMSNVDGAKVFLDGTEMGVVPLDIKDVKNGEHVLEVKAQGYQTREEKVVVNNGQSAIFKLDLNPSGDGTIKVVSPVPEAEVFIDGASVGKVPQEKGVSTGEHFVVVKLPGMKNFEEKVRVEPGQTVTVSAELKAVGKLRILSEPNGADVTINGTPSGKTPLEIDVEVGKANIRVDAPGFEPFEEERVIEGGTSDTISAKLIIAGKSPDELLAEQRGLSHFGARTLSRGRSTVAADVGYPYFANIRINVGAGRVGQFGFDAGVGVRSNLARNEIGLGVRFTMVDRDPFTVGVFGDLWWGSKLLDDSRRNGVTFDAGALASLTALSHVTITGRAYFNMWSDRHCPELMGGDFDGDPIEACEGYKARVIDGGNPANFSADDARRMEDLTGHTGRAMFDREQGIRLMIGVAAEIAIYQRWSLFGILEGAPFQDERALFTHLLTGPMFDQDLGTYLRIGTIYKF